MFPPTIKIAGFHNAKSMNSIVTSRKYNKKKYRERKAFEKRCKELSGKVYTRKATPEELEAAFGKGEN